MHIGFKPVQNAKMSFKGVTPYDSKAMAYYDTFNRADDSGKAGYYQTSCGCAADYKHYIVTDDEYGRDLTEAIENRRPNLYVIQKLNPSSSNWY